MVEVDIDNSIYSTYSSKIINKDDLISNYYNNLIEKNFSLIVENNDETSLGKVSCDNSITEINRLNYLNSCSINDKMICNIVKKKNKKQNVFDKKKPKQENENLMLNNIINISDFKTNKNINNAMGIFDIESSTSNIYNINNCNNILDINHNVDFFLNNLNQYNCYLSYTTYTQYIKNNILCISLTEKGSMYFAKIFSGKLYEAMVIDDMYKEVRI